jgi:hypothetical protein
MAIQWPLNGHCCVHMDTCTSAMASGARCVKSRSAPFGLVCRTATGELAQHSGGYDYRQAETVLQTAILTPELHRCGLTARVQDGAIFGS